MNAGANRIEEVFRRFDEPDRPCCVFYPGDRWTYGERWDSTASLARYAQRYAELREPEPGGASVAVAQLQELAAMYVGRCTSRNAIFALKLLAVVGFITPVAIRLTDLGLDVRFSPLAGLTVTADAAAEISMRSDSLAFALKHDFGGDSLIINGRFQELAPGGARRLGRAFAIGRYNQNGQTFPRSFFSPDIWKSRLGW
jgi:hypothetical protein